MFKRNRNSVRAAAEGTAAEDTKSRTEDWQPVSVPGPRLVRAGPVPADAPPELAGQPGVARQPATEAPAETTPSPPAADQTPAVAKPRGTRKLVLLTLLVVALALGGWYGQHWWTVGRFQVSTDDAYVGAHTATLAAKIPGYLVSVDVNDNAQVHTGDVIARIDDGDYQLAVETARDNVAIEQAAVERIGKQTAAQQAAVAQANAQLASAKAGALRAELELARQQSLAGKEFASRQALEQAQANRDQAVASVEAANATIAAAEANVAVFKAQQEEAKRTLKQYETAQAKAERDLSFAIIRAPYDGVGGNRAVQSGDYVQPG
jgi:membrane fusion protein, multidrug efflux system